MFDFNTETGKIRSYGVIGPFEDTISELDFMEAFDQMGGRDVEIHLQSKGGEVASGLSIHNQIRSYPGKVTVVVDSIAASIASVFPMAADKIVANKNAQIMVHDPWTVAMGNAMEFRGLADALDVFSDIIATAYADRTGKPTGYWRDVMAKEVYFSAEQAKREGLIDAVVGVGSAPKAEKAVAVVAPGFARIKTLVAAQKLRLRQTML